MMLRLVGRLLSSSGPRTRLVILVYHRVLEQQDALLQDTPDRSEFESHLAVLSANFNLIRLSEAADRLRSGTLPPRTVVITFDDGYRDNYDIALPLLEKYGVPATFFVASGFLDGGIMWNDVIIESVRNISDDTADFSDIGLGRYLLPDDSARIRTITELIQHLKYKSASERQELVSRIADSCGCSLPKDIMMSSEQVSVLPERGVEVGGHTLNHPILSRLDTKHAEAEIVGGRDLLEDITGKPVSTFAYPNGKPGKDYNRIHVDILQRNGFACGVTTSWGCATRRSDLLQLPRIAPWDKQPLRFAARVLHAYRQDRGETLEPTTRAV